MSEPRVIHIPSDGLRSLLFLSSSLACEPCMFIYIKKYLIKLLKNIHSVFCVFTEENKSVLRLLYLQRETVVLNNLIVESCLIKES